MTTTSAVAAALAASPTSAPDAPARATALIHAARLLLPVLERGQPIDAAVLRSAMEQVFGASDSEGGWDWKSAYDACEAAAVLFLRKFGGAMAARAGSAAALLPMLARLARLLPSHTRRSVEGEELQQFSTPVQLALVASTAAAIVPSDHVLEPSAGTGLLGIFAELAGASLALNELAESRAGLLGHLFPDVGVTRFDAARIPEKKEKAKDEKQPKERVKEANADARVEPAKDGYINAIQVYPYTKGALYQLYAAPAQITDIALEPGEKLVSVSAGDTVRWVVGDTTSGEGREAQVHILVKPIGTDLLTNLVITTDRRTYHLEMRSSASTYMASVSWTYPASELLALKKQRAEADVTAGAVVDAGINIEQLKFRYRIEGDAPWRPLRVFDDGTKVYIQFPSGLAQSEAPPLFVIGPDAKPALVNYRVRGTTYIVDRLFAAAELRLGTAPQRIVRIIRTDAVWRETQQ